MQDLYHQTHDELQARVIESEDRYSALYEKHQTLKSRRGQDLEGFTNDAAILRKKLAAVEKKLHEMKVVERVQVKYFKMYVVSYLYGGRCCSVAFVDILEGYNLDY